MAERVAAEEDDPVPAPDPTLVYLVNGERLQPVARSERDTVGEALEALLEGPRDTETAFGLRSAIPAGTRLLGATVQGDEVRVDLSQEFTTIAGEEYLLALAQIVFTAVDAGPADAVTIAIEGQQVPVARADGQLSTGAVTPSDYGTLAPD
jgi:spore germination protein GerM